MTPISSITRQHLAENLIASIDDLDFDELDPETSFHYEKVEFEGFKEMSKLYEKYRSLQTGDLDGWADYDFMWPVAGLY